MTQRRKLIEVALPADAAPCWSGHDTPCRSDPRAMGVKPYPRIAGAAEPLLADADRVVAGAVQKIAGLTRQVLVDLEPHATPRWPISTMRSPEGLPSPGWP